VPAPTAAAAAAAALPSLAPFRAPKREGVTRARARPQIRGGTVADCATRPAAGPAEDDAGGKAGQGRDALLPNGSLLPHSDDAALPCARARAPAPSRARGPAKGPIGHAPGPPRCVVGPERRAPRRGSSRTQGRSDASRWPARSLSLTSLARARRLLIARGPGPVRAARGQERQQQQRATHRPAAPHAGGLGARKKGMGVCCWLLSSSSGADLVEERRARPAAACNRPQSDSRVFRGLMYGSVVASMDNSVRV